MAKFLVSGDHGPSLFCVPPGQGVRRATARPRMSPALSLPVGNLYLPSSDLHSRP